MFMSILQSGAHKRNFPMAAFVSMTLAMSLPCCASTEAMSKLPTPKEVRQATERLPMLFSGQPDLPEDPIAAVQLQKKLYWSSQTSDGLLLLPVSVRYRGATNAYCRLATASAGVKEIALVKLAPQVNFDDCSGVSDLRYIDINGDELLDVIEGVRIKSNASSFQVVIPLVYISAPATGSGYCYSDAASRQLTPVDLKSDDSVRKALERAKARLGSKVFDCAP
jgi:hypothetical protein